MMPSQRPRADDRNGRAVSAVRRVINEPVKEAVHEALEEERRDRGAPDATEADRRRRGRRLIPALAAILITAYAVRRWRRSSPGMGYETEAGVERGAGEFDEGEGIQVEATGEE